MNNRSRSFRVGVDIGGTFTDVVLVEEQSGEMFVTKVSTVPADPSQGFMNGLLKALQDFSIAPAAIDFAVHGTTIATNAIIQGKGARAGLITSAGFSDVLEIAYQTRPVLYEINYEKPKPLVPRHLVVGVRGRIGPEGEVIVALDEADVGAAAQKLAAAGVEAIAIAFLHSYRDPTHERRAAMAIRRVLPQMPVVLSADVCPEYREYPRTSTTVVNAVLLPLVGPYIARLESRLAETGLECGLHLMTSSGGIVASSAAKRLPVHLVESGPAAGVIGAAFVAEGATSQRLADKILSLEPDLILGFSNLQADIARDLIRAGKNVLVTNQRSVSEILETILLIGRLVGVEVKAFALVASLESGLDEIARGASQLPRRPTVFFEEWMDPIISGIRWVEELVEIAGGDPIFPELRGEHDATRRIVDPNEVRRRDPDMILVSWCGRKMNKAQMAARPGWQDMKAVRNDQIHEIKSTLILQPGPAALTDGVSEITARIARFR